MVDKEKLIQLKHLLDEDLITQEEFDTKKKMLLGLEDNAVNSIDVDTPTTFAETEREIPELNASVEDASDSLKKKWEALIGSNAEHYLPIFEKIDKGAGSWNWCGFFFSPMWFAYRKLYGWAAAALFAPLAAGFVLGLILYSTSLDDASIEGILRVIGLAVNIFFAISANSAYKKRIDKLVNEMPENEEEKNNYIKSKGGVSVVAMIAAIVIYFP